MTLPYGSARNAIDIGMLSQPAPIRGRFASIQAHRQSTLNACISLYCLRCRSCRLPSTSPVSAKVRADGEDVCIELTPGAPVPELFSIEAAGRVLVFNLMQDRETLVVLQKFNALQMRHEGVGTMDSEHSPAAAEK